MHDDVIVTRPKVFFGHVFSIAVSFLFGEAILKILYSTCILRNPCNPQLVESENCYL